MSETGHGDVVHVCTLSAALPLSVPASLPRGTRTLIEQETLCIAYFTKVSSDEEACSELAELGLSRYLIRVLPERRLSLQNRC